MLNRSASVIALALFAAAALVAVVAEASENPIPPSITAAPPDGGIGARVFGPLPAAYANLTAQCPATDVYLRASGDGGSSTSMYFDGGLGPGDLIVSFNASSDSYPFPLGTSSGQDRIIFENVDGGSAPCRFFRVLP